MNRLLAYAAALTASLCLLCPATAHAGLKNRVTQIVIRDQTGYGFSFLVSVNPKEYGVVCANGANYHAARNTPSYPVAAGQSLTLPDLQPGDYRLFLIFFGPCDTPAYEADFVVTLAAGQTLTITLTNSNTHRSGCYGCLNLSSQDRPEWRSAPPQQDLFDPRELSLAVLATALLGGLGAVGFVLARRKE